ncbi:MAG: hypothetical protein ACLT0W_09945 [Clostridium sp.]
MKFLVNAAGFGKIGMYVICLKDQQMVQVNCTALTAVTTMVLPLCLRTAASAVCFQCSLLPAGFAAMQLQRPMCCYSRALARELKGRKML